MSGPIVTKAYMEVKGGMFPFVRNSYQSNHPVIYVKTIQKKRTDQLKKVTVYNMPEDANSVSMAFCFLYKQQNGFLVVKGNKVQIQLTTDVETAYTDKNCQFKWNAKSDKWGILKSVAEPQKYLRIVNNEFTIGTRNQGSSFRLNPE